MTLASILSDLYRRLDFPSTPASDVTTRLKAYVNETLQELLSAPGAGRWLARYEPPITIASVANRSFYAVPRSLDRITTMVDRTNQRELLAASLEWYRVVQPDPTAQTGLPTHYIPLGQSAVAVQPSTTGLWAVSSSASDTTPVVYYEAIRTDGTFASGSVTLTGTTRVALSSATDIVSVTKWYLSAAAVGTVSLYDASSSGNVLGVIPIGQTYAKYYGFYLYPTPASAVTYHIDGERCVSDLTVNTDEPPIPSRFHRLLVDGALAREYEKRSDDRVGLAMKRYQDGVKDWRYFVTCPPDYLPVAGNGKTDVSRLGGWYPDGAGVR